MFKWLGQSDNKEKKPWQREISLTPILRWFNHPVGKSQKKTDQTKPAKQTEISVAPVAELAESTVKPAETPQSVIVAPKRKLLKISKPEKKPAPEKTKKEPRTETEAKAIGIIEQAEIEAREIKTRAEIEAQKRAEAIIVAAQRRAEVTESEVKRKALQFLITASEEVNKEIKEEYMSAYSKLSNSLQQLMSEVQNIESELETKVAKLREGRTIELKQYESMLLSTPTPSDPDPPAEVPGPGKEQNQAADWRFCENRSHCR